MNVEHTIQVSDKFIIDERRFEDADQIEQRVGEAEEKDKGSLRTALKYLYMIDGPVNLPRVRLKTAESYLTVAERLVARYLYTRSNGRLRKTYGAKSLIAARSAKYRCAVCGTPDVRVMNLDHVDKDDPDTEFALLCANCHAIKSREQDWTGT